MKFLLAITLLLSVLSLIIPQSEAISPTVKQILSNLDYVILALLIIDLAWTYRSTKFKRAYFKGNFISLLLFVMFVVLLAFGRISAYLAGSASGSSQSVAIITVRNIFALLRIFRRFSRLHSLLEQIATHPARSMLFSFLGIILLGALLLMQPFASSQERGLSFIDALFTSTSAVCVTGLIVVDTASAFSIYGKLIILGLIQIGGLGIMILSYFTIFILGRSASIEDKMLISYAMSEKDMTKVTRSLRLIIYITFSIEGFGALLLFFGFWAHGDINAAQSIFYAVFHSISAFCNAGFSLFSDNLEGFRTDGSIVIAIAILIILGGISFSVLINLKSFLTRGRIRNGVRELARRPRLATNTKVVLAGTGLLLLIGTLVIYGLEHGNTMAPYSLGNQYLSALFQSVSLRTAGFNTIPFHSLRPVTYIAAAVFMFVGGASGSTAGGIKINTVSVMFSYLVASVRDRESAILYKSSIPSTTVLRAFLILLFGISVVAGGTILLAFFETAPVQHLMFEAVSAFGTVGLSSGLTGSLTMPGKLTVILLMYLGRIGPLTVLAAASLSARKNRIAFPRGEIAIG